MKIKKFSVTDHYIKALVYGSSGSGKTTFAGTAPDAIFASAEGGLMSIGDRRPDFVEIKSLRDLMELRTYLQNEEHAYKTVIIDSITEINEIIKLEIQQRTGRNMQLQDWGDLARKMRDILRSFRDLPMHVLFLAQETTEEDEQKIAKYMPALNGKAANEIAYFMDIVGYLRIDGDGTRVMITASNAKYLTKDRSQKIGNDTEIDFAVWMQKIGELETSEQEEVVSYSAADLKNYLLQKILTCQTMEEYQVIREEVNDKKKQLDEKSQQEVVRTAKNKVDVLKKTPATISDAMEKLTGCKIRTQLETAYQGVVVKKWKPKEAEKINDCFLNCYAKVTDFERDGDLFIKDRKVMAAAREENGIIILETSKLEEAQDAYDERQGMKDA